MCGSSLTVREEFRRECVSAHDNSGGSNNALASRGERAKCATKIIVTHTELRAVDGEYENIIVVAVIIILI